MTFGELTSMYVKRHDERNGKISRSVNSGRSPWMDVFLRKLDLRSIVRNPLGALPTLGALVATAVVIEEIVAKDFSRFNLELVVLLWLSALVMNFFEAAESSLRFKARGVMIRRLTGNIEEIVPADSIRKGQLIVCKIGDLIPADGIVVAGTATVDESALTGESVNVIRENRKDRENVLAGTRVLAGRIVMRVTRRHKDRFAEHIDTLLESPHHHLTGDERMMYIPIWFLVISFSVLFICSPLLLSMKTSAHQSFARVLQLLPFMIALWLCTIPITIGRLIGFVDVSLIRRLLEKDIMPEGVNAIESAGEVDTLISDDDIDPVTAGRIAPVRTLVVKDRDEYLRVIRRESAAGHSIAAVGTRDQVESARGFSNLRLSVDGSEGHLPGEPGVVDIGRDYSHAADLIESGRRMISIKNFLTFFGIGSTVAAAAILLPPVVPLLLHQSPNESYLNSMNILGSPYSALLAATCFGIIEYVIVVMLTAMERNLFRFQTKILHSPAISFISGLICSVAGIKIIDMVLNVV